MSFSVCKFYSYNRNCKFGNNCRYLHSEITQRPPPPSVEEASHRSVKESDNQDQPQCQTPTLIPRQSKEINHEEPVRSTPAYYNPKVSSNLDSFSRRRRANDDASKEVIRNSPIAEASGGSNTSAEPEPRNVCRYFKQHGYCAFGRNCKFVHVNVEESPSEPQPRFTQHGVRRQIPPRFQRKESSQNHQASSDDLKTTEFKDLSEPDIQIVQSDLVTEPNNTSAEESAVCNSTSSNTGTSSGNAARGNGKLCRYFKSGYCSRGRRCMFVHHQNTRVHKKDDERGEKAQPNKDDEVEGRDEATKSKSSVTANYQTRYARPIRPSGVLPQVVTLSDIQANGTEKYRQFDVNYLEKRFQAIKLEEEEHDETIKKLTMEVNFSPSDPDWPFDVKTYTLHITLAEGYPEKAMSVTVPEDKQELPATVQQHLEETLNEWISDRQKELTKNNKAELMVRPFFRWLDRNFEDVMTDALKQLKRELTARAAGFEIIPAAHLKAKFTANDDADDGSSSNEDAYDSLAEDDDESSDECLGSDDESDDDSDSDEERRGPALSLDTDRRGTEIQLRHLQLKQNASSLLFEKLRLIVQCGRCKHHSEVTVGGEKAVALTCEKCSHEMYVQYRPTLAHQFSSVVGYLDLDSCTAFDLIFPDCKIVVSCLGCGKVTKINGMTSGQMSDGWCQACNARFKFATETVKFYQLQPSDFDEEKKKHAEVSRPKNAKKPPKDPAIREGQPLPDFGTCRHYKQSYRWLRFPCCGKAYPCDVCHDKKEDHEMTLATRMICGHCCKEQNYSATRPCISCSHHMTKVHSAHWEGGSGCRDRIAMSRNDQHKYKNMNKTISRKKGQSASGAKKKTTKLRHA